MSVLVYYLVIRIRERTWCRKNEKYGNRNRNRKREDIHIKSEKYGKRLRWKWGRKLKRKRSIDFIFGEKRK